MNHIKLILVAPKYSGNVGACARVAANFSVQDFCVVAPQCDIHDEQAQLYGKGPARDYLMNARIFSTLSESLQDCHYAVALTRRFGELSPEEIIFKDIAHWVMEKEAVAPSEKKIAFVFGREDNCLNREELFCCTHFCCIPTSAEMPTMNLSHSVAVVLSRLYADLDQNSFLKNNENILQRETISIEDFQALMDHFKDTLRDMGLTKGGDPEKMLNRLHRALQRSDLDVHELAQLRRFLSKVRCKAQGIRHKA